MVFCGSPSIPYATSNDEKNALITASAMGGTNALVSNRLPQFVQYQRLRTCCSSSNSAHSGTIRRSPQHAGHAAIGGGRYRRHCNLPRFTSTYSEEVTELNRTSNSAKDDDFAAYSDTQTTRGQSAHCRTRRNSYQRKNDDWVPSSTW